MWFNIFLAANLLSILLAVGLFVLMALRPSSFRLRFFQVFILVTLAWLLLQLGGVILPISSELRLTIWRFSLVFSSYMALTLSLLIIEISGRNLSKKVFLPIILIQVVYTYLLLMGNHLIAGINDTSSIFSPIIFGTYGWLFAFSHTVPLIFALRAVFMSRVTRQISSFKTSVIVAGILIPFVVLMITSFVTPLLDVNVPRFTPVTVIILVTIYYLATSQSEKILSRFTIKNKVFWSITLSSLATVFVANVMMYYTLPRIFVGFELEHLSRELQHVSSEFNGEVLGLKKLVVSNEFSRSIDSILIATTSADQSIDDITRLAQEFSTLLTQHGEISQISVIAKNGMEIVKVESIANEPTIASKQQLLNQSHSPTFLSIMRSKPNDIYVSKIHLDRSEYTGEIRKPAKPVLLVASPFFDSQNQFKGAVIIKSVVVQLFATVGESTGVNRRELFVVDSQGYFAHSPITREEWGGPDDYDTNDNLRNKDSFLADSLISAQPQQFEYQDRLYASDTVQLSNVDKSNYLSLIISEPTSNLAAILSDITSIIIIIEAIGLATVTAVAFLLSNSIARPIEALTKKIRLIEAGNLNVNVATQSVDEVGELSRSTQILLNKLKDEKSSVSKKVQEQTSQLSQQIIETEKTKRALINVLEDLYEEKRASESFASELKRFQLAVENASDHIIITDPEGFIIYANPAAEKITGFPRREILGTKAGQLWGKKMSSEFYKQMWHTIKEEKKTFSGRINNHRKNGEDYIAESSITPILDNNDEVSFFVAIERDITKAIDVDRMKTEFISLASHQMRTPLSAMRWFCELLLDGSAGQLTPEQLTYVENISKSNERLIELVNALLDISRIESGRLTIEPINTDLHKLAEDAVTALNEEMKKKNISVTVSAPDNLPQISVDPKLIFQVYTNLIGNAIKYTGDGGKVIVTVSETPDSLVSEIADTGLGIPTSQIHRVFERFFRGDNVMKTTGGTGLGLYLAKTIITASGGLIWFESKENIGSKFFFSLPKSGSPAHRGEVTLSRAE